MNAQEDFATESTARLIQAELSGLRIALIGRSAITGAAFFWYALAAILFPEITPRVLTIFVLLSFAMDHLMARRA